MTRSTRLLLALWLAAAGTVGASAAEPAVAPATPAEPPAGQRPSDPSQSEVDRQDELRRAEIEKLEAEIDGLRLQNQALGVQTRRWSAWLGAIGGVTGALLTFVLGFLGWRLNTLQQSRARQDEKLSLRKLEQDRFLEREKQNLGLYKGLGDENPRVQLAATSVLLERLSTFRERRSRGEEVSELETIERPTIILVLIAVIKESGEETTTHRALRKHIADHLVKVLDAAVPAGGRPPEGSESPLKAYDWQYANLAEVWWEGVDARGVDFFRANFRNAGLARSSLQRAVFYEADLTDAVLKGAHLEGTSFYGAHLDGARLNGATSDAATVWPEGFDPVAAGVESS